MRGTSKSLSLTRTGLLVLGLLTLGFGTPTSAQSQAFIIDDSDQRLSYEWISNSMQQFGIDETALVFPGGFDEVLEDGAIDQDYEAEVFVSQASDILSSSFVAAGTSSFAFAAGEFAQGAHIDVESRSFFYLYFEPAESGTLTLTGSLATSGSGTTAAILIEASDGSSFQSSTPGPVDLSIPIDLGTFYLIQFVAETDYLVDNPSLFEFEVDGSASFDLQGILTGEVPFRRGDCNADGAVDVSDPVVALDDLFIGTAPQACPLACDTNDDGTFDISDPVYALAFLFAFGAEPLPPFDTCGVDPTPTALACPTFAGCP